MVWVYSVNATGRLQYSSKHLFSVCIPLTGALLSWLKWNCNIGHNYAKIFIVDCFKVCFCLLFISSLMYPVFIACKSSIHPSWLHKTFNMIASGETYNPEHAWMKMCLVFYLICFCCVKNYRTIYSVAVFIAIINESLAWTLVGVGKNMAGGLWCHVIATVLGSV